jgi:hypothetical protein
MEEAEEYAVATPMVKPRIPPLLCPHCGVCDVPRIGPGTQTHVARALCSGCGRYLKWLPKALLGLEQKEQTMGGIARCVVIGVIGKYGCSLHYATSGAACASFTLVVSEQGSDGRTYNLFVPCEVWGKKAEGASELAAGQLCLFEGKLARRKQDADWTWVVAGWDVTPIMAPTASTGGRTN